MHVVGGCRRPLEAHAVEYLCSVFVGGVYPARRVAATHILGHQRPQQSDKIGILHHLLQSLLELLLLYTLQRNARLSKAHKDVAEELAMGI